MFKNIASQKLIVYAHNVVNDSAETGDADNITGFYSLDGAEPVVLSDTNPAELHETNMPGIYVFDLSQAETNANMITFYPVSDTEGVRLDVQMIYTLASGVNITQISGDSVAADNLKLQYDGTSGLLGDIFPLRQDQGAGIAGGLAIHTTMVSVAVIQGSQQDLDNTNTSDDSRWTGDDDGSGAEFIFRCTPTDTSDIPVDLHFEGYYDEPTGATNGATLQIYDFQNSQWDTILTFNKASKDEIHDVSISHIHKAPGGDTVEGVAYTIGDVLIKFKQDTQETGNACLLIDHMTVGFVGSLVTADEIANAIKAITGITVGGTWTWEKIMKINAAWIAGNWRVKSSDSTVQELMDAEDGTTVILEQSLTRSPTVGNKYRDISVKI